SGLRTTRLWAAGESGEPCGPVTLCQAELQIVLSPLRRNVACASTVRNGWLPLLTTWSRTTGAMYCLSPCAESMAQYVSTPQTSRTVLGAGERHAASPAAKA